MAVTLRRAAETISTSNADDGAFRALIDAAQLTADLDETRVVGGQMVSLLTLAYSNAPRLERRTAEAVIGVSTTIAGRQIVHSRLISAGYVAESGNRYERDGAIIDLLAPSLDGRFSAGQISGRGIDLAPGLELALQGDPLIVDLGVTFRDGRRTQVEARVPRVEIAVILKSLATRSRSAAKDVTDLYNLLNIAYTYADDELGGWKLSGRDVTGARKDSVRALRSLCTDAYRNPLFAQAEVPVERFVALVGELILQ